MQANMLKGKLVESGMTQEAAANKIGISLSRFNSKINERHNAEFTLNEVIALKDALHLSLDEVSQIFFTCKGDFTHKEYTGSRFAGIFSRIWPASSCSASRLWLGGIASKRHSS